jgi:hypothetical protein
VRQRLIETTLAYRQRTGQTVDTWWVPKGRQAAMVELLERAAREKRHVTEAETTMAKGGYTALQGLIAKPA